MSTSVPTKYTTPIFKKDTLDDSHTFQPLPEPSGDYPYHLSLATVKPDVSPQKMVFHMVGDTGGIRNPDFQQLVAVAMAEQYNQTKVKEDQLQFLYHLGDIVYHHGEASGYEQQFFKPFAVYPGPVFAIAGNHDSDVNPAAPVPYQSLDAFTTVFCDTKQRKIVFSGNAKRKSMIQPNIYWTLKSPLANIIGLHSNVPKFGIITAEQRKWFMDELSRAHRERPDKALIVCLHHSPYSADINHGSSKSMISFLENVFDETGIKPDMVFSGHVHNYQRFHKTYADGTIVPYIVAGAGGFDELHSLAMVGDDRFTNHDSSLKNVKLEAYSDDQHGFLQITIEKTGEAVNITGKYYTVTHQTIRSNKQPLVTLVDQFVQHA